MGRGGGFKTAKIRSSAVTNASVSAPFTEHFYYEGGASELRHSSVNCPIRTHTPQKLVGEGKGKKRRKEATETRKRRCTFLTPRH